jgi:outer membrane protein assembly factor BamE (lipoprotein component of BamABCDE complex)
MRCLILSSIALMLASCTPIVNTRGHSAEDVDLSQLVPGQSSADDVRALLGSPTSTSNFGDVTWYYITQKQSRVGVFAPEVSEQHVTAITFDAEQRVQEISAFKKEDGQNVQIVSKTTPTEGHSIGFIEQMLGNFGRFNAPTRGLSDRNRGR